MKRFQTAIFPVLALSLAACADREPEHTHHTYDGPALYGFHIYDSYDVDSQVDDVSDLSIDPEAYGGWFELFWEVESPRDYTVVIGINDSPSMAEATIIGSELCGDGLSCDPLSSLFVCRYDIDGYLGCGRVEEEAELNAESINHLLFEYPHPLFINIEVCDVAGRGCESGSLPVWVY